MIKTVRLLTNSIKGNSRKLAIDFLRIAAVAQLNPICYIFLYPLINISFDKRIHIFTVAVCFDNKNPARDLI